MNDMRTVHDVIGAHQPEILRLWVQGIRESVFAEALSPSELASVMPDYLGSLGRIEMDGPPQLSDQQYDLVERHLSNRLRQGSTLNEILTEFAVLGRVIAWFLDRDGNQWRPSTRDAANLFAELHLACVAAMKIFNEQLLEDEQPLKRYLRLLQNLADDGGSSSAARQPVGVLMKEALSLISKAMRARSVALRLHRARTDELLLAASAGDADELLQEYAGSHAGAIPAATFTSLPDTEDGGGAEFVALEPSEALRARGIESVLVVRLSSRQTLRAVMYVGVAGRVAFSPSELRQVATLGEALAIHLDHAQLCTELRTTAADALAECQLRERFVSMLMHDLAGPLAAARSSAAALLEPGRVETGEVLALRILHELGRAEEMVDVLVDAHRIRAGQRLPMVITRCSLSSLTRDVVAELRACHGDRLIFAADGNVSGMWSADQLRRAVWNLASNAIKYGAPDAPVLVSVKRNAEGAELIVHNDGKPISPEDQAQLFRPFASPSSGRGHPPGWGLGLTLVWGCAEAHGGRVEVTSGATEGTTFRLLIPYDARPYAE
jgi:signal transduction histidine kinase